MVLLLLLVPSTEAFTRRRRKGLEGGHGGTPIVIDVSTSPSAAHVDANTGSDADQASPQVRISSGWFVLRREMLLGLACHFCIFIDPIVPRSPSLQALLSRVAARFSNIAVTVFVLHVARYLCLHSCLRIRVGLS